MSKAVTGSSEGRMDISKALEYLNVLVESYNGFVEKIASDAVKPWVDLDFENLNPAAADVQDLNDDRLALSLGARELVKKVIPLEKYREAVSGAMQNVEYQEIHDLCSDFVRGTSYMKTLKRLYTAKSLKSLGMDAVPDF